MDNNRLWGRIIRDHRIVRSETVPIEGDDVEGAFLELCRRFDVQRPLQLPKHDREFAEFGHTAYTKDHFVEPVSFARLEIELLSGDGHAKRGHPHTPLMDA